MAKINPSQVKELVLIIKRYHDDWGNDWRKLDLALT